MGEPETLDVEEPLRNRIERHAYDRLIMLSDGVFSIVMTLAAIEIRPPEQAPDRLGALFAAMLPMLVPYAISFAVIAAYWWGHRRMMARLIRVDGGVTLLTLGFLALVALQPSALRLLTPRGYTPAANSLYYLLIVATGLVESILWCYAAFVAKLVHPDVGRGERWVSVGRSLLVPLLCAIASVQASRHVHAGIVPIALGLLLLATIIGALRSRGRSSAGRPA